tara:strand:+ start:3653 stop:4984 length:1332 start_codon:yes stop_codon:yes gene_type:complete
MNINGLEKTKTFSFDRSHSANILFKRPDKFREIEDLSKHNRTLINTGSNLSYSPLGFYKDSISVKLKKFNRIIDFNLKKKEITVESGITLSQLLNFTLLYDLWIPQLPGYPFITLGGAIASDAHGKSCALHGTIKNSIKEMTIFHIKNGWLSLSEKENKEIYNLTIGGIGLTGTIVNVTLKLEEFKNKNFITYKTKVNSVNECISEITKKSKENDSFVYSWNLAENLKSLGKGFVFQNKTNNDNVENFKFIPEDKKNKFLPFLPIWNKLTLKTANWIFYYLNSSSNHFQEDDFTSVIFPFYGKEAYFKFFGKKGFYESQLLISENTIDDFFDEFKFIYKKFNPTISLFSIKNMRGTQEFLRFEDNKICVTFDFINNKKNILFMSELDKICVKLKIIPSIIKDSRLSKKIVEQCYPEYSRFRDLINNYDKKRIYKSEISQRLEI